MNNWISVKDRLPDVSGQYLGYCEQGVIEIEFSLERLVLDVSYFNSMGCGCCSTNDIITHWMQLPEPPNE